MKDKLIIIASALLLFSMQIGLSQELSIAEPVRYLALGDSYTIGESIAPSGRWPQQLYDSLANRGYQTETLKIIAQTGWRTDNLMQAIENANLTTDYNLVSLLIGVNNQFQGGSIETYEDEFEELLLTAIELAGGNKSNVFVLSIPDYGYTPFGEKRNSSVISEEIEEFNRVNKNITEYFGITYYNITPISQLGLSNPELVAGDGLHPSEKMYTEWVNLILNDIPYTSVTAVPFLDAENKISIYPNPVSYMLFIEVDQYDNSALAIQLIDSTGRKVMDRIYYDSISSLHLGNTSPGLYLLKVGYNEQIITRKIMVQSGP